jgi:hypothetical protein
MLAYKPLSSPSQRHLCAVLRSLQAVAGAPQLLTMKVDAVRARHELLTSLAALQPGWASQLADASKETLAVWLCSRCAAEHVC